MRIWRLVIEVADGEAESDEFSMHDLMNTLKQMEEEQRMSTVEIKEIEVMAA